MKKLYFVSVLLLGIIVESGAQTLLHYWNFNNSTDQSTLLTPTISLVGSATITHEAGGSSLIEVPGTGANFSTENLNARNGDASGDHLRFNNPGSGGSLLFSIPTTGYTDVIIKYATRRSSTTAAAENQVITYTTDGVNYMSFTSLTPDAANPALATLDFSSIVAVENNPDFSIRIACVQGTGGTTGNHRFDNFTVEGINMNGDTSAPEVSFSPLNNATGVFITENLVITFNEDVRLIDNNAIDNTNVDALVELRAGSAFGQLVDFDATVSGKVITVNPTVDLGTAQVYYLALIEDVVEDLSDNAIATTKSILFETLEEQTVFTAGDLLFVAYRMNASGTDDEIALLTFVNILPGTLINFTDAKYTDNAIPQCSGGFTWKAPAADVAAGTVLTIKTDAITPSIGSASGSGFGLSSSGDQVIVYTGSAANPIYITALSSNAWAGANSSCSGNTSKIPSALADQQNALSLSTAPGNTSGNTVNAYYNGMHSGTVAELKAAILNPINWVGVASGTAAQTWPTWAFPGPPSVTTMTVVNQNTLKISFNNALDATSAASIDNYAGIADLQSATLSEDGKQVTLTYNTSFSVGNTYTLTVDNLINTSGLQMFTAYTKSFTYNTKISLATKFVAVNENAGNVNITLNVENPSTSSVTISLKPAPWSTATSGDHSYQTQVVNLDGASALTQNISIPIVDDNLAEQDEYLVIALENADGLSVTGSTYFTLFIKDNDRAAPTGNKSIELSHVTSYAPPLDGTAEIVAHDPLSNRIFIVSSVENRLDIADFSNPSSVAHIASIDMAPYGGITSVAVKDGIVAVASPNADQQQNGSVVFLDTNGTFKKQVSVGALPDMITFSPDGTKVLTANEGQPNDSYTIDPEGSVSVIDISGGITGLMQSHVSTLLFEQFNSETTALVAAGVRKLKSTSTLSRDLEPEYITVSEDSKKAWVTLQENNAIAEINLETKTYTGIWPLGKKDLSAFGSGFDASDNNGVILNANWPVKSFYIPDGVGNFTAGGTRFLVTANEGDEREYAGLNERTTVSAVILDPTIFPNASVLKETHNLGRLRITNLSGDADADGDYDELNVVGARSFTIWNASTHEKVYDSGDDFERITAADPVYGALFNADHENNTFKGRSRAKGPEPEGIAIATFNDHTYAFVALERVGGIMVYDVTDPSDVKFVDYKNNRGTVTYTGDHGPEGIAFISRENSPDGKRYVLVANEISGTVSVYEVQGKDDQAIAFDEITDKTIGDEAFQLSASATSELDIAFSTEGDEVTIDGSEVTLAKAGFVTISASQPGNDFFNAAAAVERSFCVNPAKPAITVSGDGSESLVLSSTEADNYQWFKDGDEMDGETGRTLAITEEGVYAVQVYTEECYSVLSDNLPIIVTGLGAIEKSEISLFPIPVEDQLSLTLPANGVKKVTIFDSNGRARMTTVVTGAKTVLAVNDLNHGYFILRVETSSGKIFHSKFIKK
jgi:hypothetical protein